ncbi:cation-translocating P-type ATPase [Autumnicola edwardsiae]|uniref:Cation-transporting P-type ATPase n=1 Tax=Autumnicola edwardsiae TaxID=3075594 RepID=A0ABU3CVH7_9FLAO|nr:cation-transporting P-type ATPase [Zunongwangia sp. F297]MDT0650359.1 cation-transporting P-type ATPase [Zunongwangia sp. F297]
MAEPSKNKAVKDAYRKEWKEVADSVSSDPENGLSHNEVEKRLDRHGRNKLKESKQRSIWQIILSQINNPVIYLLTAAAALAFAFGDIPEAVAILAVLLVNTIIGFWMEYQAQKSMEAIKEMDKIQARVLRDGKDIEIDAEEVVPGDVLLLEAGDLVSADARLVEATELKADEAPLTGESVPVDKTTEIIEDEKQVADRTNIVYKGTAITGGKGKAIVFGTGMDTEMGNISAMVQEQEDEETPLNLKLNKLTKNLIWVILAMAAAFFLIGWIAGKEVYQLVQTSIAWAIAAIPEGLPIVASIALARGMYRLSKKNVLIKKLSAVETLGETTVIFTDKTGTLTKNELTVDSFCLPEKELIKVDWHGGKKPTLENTENPEENENFSHMLKISVLANDASLGNDNEAPGKEEKKETYSSGDYSEGDNSKHDKDEENGDDDKNVSAKGDPLEIALLNFVSRFDKDFYREKRGLERKLHDPFDSESMVMGTAYKEDDKFYIAGKGSTDAILDRSHKILIKGELKDLSEDQKEKWKKQNNDLAENGLRVLAFAYKETDTLPEGDEAEDFLQELTLVGLIGFLDPPRVEVTDSIDGAKAAGIKVVMVTGDHPGTAKNVGRQVHLSEEDEQKDSEVLHGKHLQEELEKDNNEKLVTTPIFSRVDPEQKLKLIQHYQDEGEIVGMTGDGVNDAPALKKADIGIAMGKRGTQVAQEVSDVVLKDDSFESIVKAIEQGRTIFGNIRRFVMYQLSYHLAEILIIALMSFTLFILPILPLQLLFLNLLSDVFPALALGIGEGNPHVMKLPPKDPEEPIITRKNWTQIVIYGIIIALSVSGAYLYSHYVWGELEEINNNIAFFSLALAQFLHVFNMREADENFFNNQVTRNKYVWMAIGLCTAVLFAAYFIPVLAEVFAFQRLDFRVWIIIIIASILPTIIIQAIKMIWKDF